MKNLNNQIYDLVTCLGSKLTLNLIFTDCGDLSLPEKFSSFSGHEAHNIGKN